MSFCLSNLLIIAYLTQLLIAICFALCELYGDTTVYEYVAQKMVPNESEVLLMTDSLVIWH